MGEVQPPHLVMPITVEPTKPRMCHDSFKTCGLRIAPFRWITYLTSLGTLVLVIFRLSVTTRVATTTFVYLRPVEPFLGFHGKVVISFIIPSPSDGRQVPSFTSPLVWWRQVILELWACPARNTSTIAMQASLWCAGIQPLQFGLILNWPKPLLLLLFQFSFHWVISSRCQNRLLSVPSQRVRFLGYLSDSVLMALVLPEDKKLKFKTLREFIYLRNLWTLRLCNVFLAKPLRSLWLSPLLDFIRVPHFVLFRPVLSHKPLIVAGDLLREVQYWRFPGLPWFEERHVVISTFSDASNSGWGGVFSDKSGNSVQVRDIWSSGDSSQPIIIREALALKNTLMAGAASLAASRVDAHVDSPL